MSVVDRKRNFRTTTTVGGPSVVDRQPAIVNRFTRGFFGPDVTFARASTVNGWTLDANGDPVLTEFASGAPAFVIDPATGQALGYRALQGFTNSLLWSRDLSQSDWVKDAGISLSQDRIGLKGESNKAWTITGTGTERIYQTVTIPDDSNPCVWTPYIEKDQNQDRFPEFDFVLDGGTTPVTGIIQIDTETGQTTVRSGSFTDSYAEDAGDFWRLILVQTNNGTGNTIARNFIKPGRSSVFGGTSNTTGSIVYDFGGVYLNSEAGPPIETEGTPVSTAADDATEPLPASCQDGFVWVVELRLPEAVEDSVFIGSVRNNSASPSDNRIFADFRNGNQVRLFVEASGVSTSGQWTYPEITSNATIKVAIRAKDGEASISVAGNPVESLSFTGFPSGMNEKNIAQLRSGTYSTKVFILQDRMWSDPENWSNARLQEAATS